MATLCEGICCVPQHLYQLPPWEGAGWAQSFSSKVGHKWQCWPRQADMGELRNQAWMFSPLTFFKKKSLSAW